MTVISPSATDLSMEGETLANDYHWRSTKAKQQLRDRFGRWISLGANIRFRGDGAEQSGVVTSVIDGKAYVDQKNLDGTISQKIIDPSAIRVIASKATLPKNGKKIRDEGNNFAAALKTPEFLNALDSSGEAVIERADGYALAANMVDEAMGGENKAHDGTETKPIDDKSKGNNIMYQLFAPAGRSLGKYGQAAEGDFDAMVAEDQGGQPVDTSPAGEGEAAPAAVAASVEVTGSEKPYRVPESVKNEIHTTISCLSVELPEADLAVATRLANDSTVSLSDVEWVHGFFAENELSESLRGGFKGRKWATKIVESGDEFSIREDLDDGLGAHPKYTFDDETSGYFAVGKYAGSTLVHKLIAVDYETGMVSTWSVDGFEVNPDLDMSEVDEPQIIPIDEMTADEFAHWLDSGTAEEFDILDTNPEERNLFTLADSEIDYDELDRSYSIIAAAGDGVYTPVERSQNAKVQQRGAGGKFGETPDAVAAVPEGESPKVRKATLPVELPIVVDPAARISEWLSTAAEAPVVAAGEASGTPEYTEEDQAVEDAATGPTDEALYFAIVDEIDKAAVLDAIAIVKSNGKPSAFLRQGGAWAGSPDTLTLLQGSTPPTVVELPDPATVKTVLEQIDAYDSGADMTPDPEEAALPKPGEVPLAASGWDTDPVAHLASKGYAMADGKYLILDAKDITRAVAFAGEGSDIFTKAHIRKRARALNRMDLVPAEWREFTLSEIGELSADRHAYGEFGEILVASAARKGGGNGTQLKAYWTTGKGALKIRWGTKGDLTRAHKHLAKYVGPERSWGLAQSYHQSLFGVYNHTHDVATGQYVPRRKK